MWVWPTCVPWGSDLCGSHPVFYLSHQIQTDTDIFYPVQSCPQASTETTCTGKTNVTETVEAQIRGRGLNRGDRKTWPMQTNPGQTRTNIEKPRSNQDKYRTTWDKYRTTRDKYRTTRDKCMPNQDKYRSTQDKHRPTSVCACVHVCMCHIDHMNYYSHIMHLLSIPVFFPIMPFFSQPSITMVMSVCRCVCIRTTTGWSSTQNWTIMSVKRYKPYHIQQGLTLNPDPRPPITTSQFRQWYYAVYYRPILVPGSELTSLLDNV